MCVRSSYRSTSSTTNVRADSSILERYKSVVREKSAGHGRPSMTPEDTRDWEFVAATSASGKGTTIEWHVPPPFQEILHLYVKQIGWRRPVDPSLAASLALVHAGRLFAT